MELLQIGESIPDVFGLGQNVAMNLGVPRVRWTLGKSDPRGTLGGGGWRGSFPDEVHRLMPIIERPQSEGLQRD